MLDHDGFGNDRTEANRPCEPGQRDEQMNQKEDDFAHLWIVAKRGQNDQSWLNLAIRHPRIHFAGLTTNPDEAWLLQIARNVTDAEEGFLRGKRYILMDRDTKFSEVFRNTLEDGGVRPVRLPPHSPNLNSHIERFRRSLKEECLGRMIFFGEKALHTAIVSYVEHFLTERNHQGVSNRLLLPGSEVGQTAGDIACRERLGGLLQYFYRKAA